jgi:hypothetical protein
MPVIVVSLAIAFPGWWVTLTRVILRRMQRLVTPPDRLAARIWVHREH